MMGRVRTFTTFLLVSAACLSAPAFARSEFSPYVEGRQTIDIGLDKGNADTTYTSLGGGFDAMIQNQRIDAQASYFYERIIPIDNNSRSQDLHSGLARGRATVLTDFLNVEGGAIATRTRTDIRGAVPNASGSGDNISKVYGFYGGPTIDTKVSDFDVMASYRAGHVEVDHNYNSSIMFGTLPLDRYRRATSHDVSGSIGMQPGELPFGWKISGGWLREDVSQLDQRYDGSNVRGELTFPVGATLALVGSAGYEDIEISQREPIRDANGIPVLDNTGHFQIDPTQPRVIAFDTKGAIWDVGFLWKPSSRTTLEARGGERYGSTAYTMRLEHRITKNLAFQAAVFNSLDSFGRSIVEQLTTMPTSFHPDRNLLSNDMTSCVFGSRPGTGSCFSGVLQSTSTTNYRSRGGLMMMSGKRGGWQMELSAIYVEHKFLAPKTPTFFSLNGIVDKTFSIEANAERRLDAESMVSVSVIGDWRRSGIPGFTVSRTITVAGDYMHQLTDHVLGFAGAGAYHRHSGSNNRLNSLVFVGARYRF